MAQRLAWRMPLATGARLVWCAATTSGLRAEPTYFEQTGLKFDNGLFARDYTGANDYRFRCIS